MDFVKKIKAILKKYPKAYICYCDAETWAIYPDKKAYNKDADPLLEGWCTRQYGYVDDLVVALAEMVGIKVDSI